MKPKLDTRTTQIDVEKCVRAAGNRFDLIISGAQRLRELKKIAQEKNGFATAVDPLLEVQNNTIDIQEYLKKVK